MSLFYGIRCILVTANCLLFFLHPSCIRYLCKCTSTATSSCEHVLISFQVHSELSFSFHGIVLPSHCQAPSRHLQRSCDHGATQEPKVLTNKSPCCIYTIIHIGPYSAKSLSSEIVHVHLFQISVSSICCISTQSLDDASSNPHYGAVV